MNEFQKYAMRELRAMGWDLEDQTDGPNKWARENLLELLEVFGKQGHSGNSAPWILGMFAKLAAFEPLGPLTGADSEWTDVGGSTQQNNRCGHVFKGSDGRAYDSEGRIFREPSGACYTSLDSRVYITFPYTPKRVYLDVPADLREGVS